MFDITISKEISPNTWGYDVGNKFNDMLKNSLLSHLYDVIALNWTFNSLYVSDDCVAVALKNQFLRYKNSDKHILFHVLKDDVIMIYAQKRYEIWYNPNIDKYRYVDENNYYSDELAYILNRINDNMLQDIKLLKFLIYN